MTRIREEDQIQGVTGDVRRFVDMLDVPERLQQLHQSHAVCVDECNIYAVYLSLH